MYRVDFRSGGIATAVAIGGAMLLAACSADTTESRSHNLSLSLTTRSSSGIRASSGVSHDIAVGPAGELVLKRIQLIVDRIELSPSDNVVCTGDDEVGDDMSSDADCEDMARDPILVNVPVDDAVHTVVSVPVAAGTYTRLEARIEPVASATAATLGAPADMADKSIRVEGTFKGVPFVFTSALRTSFEFEFSPPLVVDAGGKNATLNIDVTRWFIAANGSVIDPNTANAGQSNEGLVAGNIRSSFNAFEDDDKSGDDDHEAGSRDGSGRGGDR